MVLELQVKTSQIPQVEIPPKLLSPTSKPGSHYIRAPWKSVSGPISCAESKSGLHWSIAPLVLTLQAKMPRFFNVKNSAHYLFTNLYKQYLQLELHRRVFLDLFDANYSLRSSIAPLVVVLQVARARPSRATNQMEPEAP